VLHQVSQNLCRQTERLEVLGKRRIVLDPGQGWCRHITFREGLGAIEVNWPGFPGESGGHCLGVGWGLTRPRVQLGPHGCFLYYRDFFFLSFEENRGDKKGAFDF
jgi:hypothetical protein